MGWVLQACSLTHTVPSLQVHHAYTQAQVATLRGHSSAVVTLQWAPGDHTLLSVGVNGAVYFWCTRTWQRLADLEHVDKRCIYAGGVFYGAAAAHQGQGQGMPLSLRVFLLDTS